MLFLFGTFFFLLLVASLRLFQIQIISYNKYAKLAGEQHGLLLQKNQLRGAIYDRNGNLLRSSIRKWYLLIRNTNPKQWDEFRNSLSFLPPDFIRQAKANQSKVQWVYSKPLNSSEIDRVIQLQNPDLQIVSNLIGRDNTSELAWHLLGMIGDGKGQSGLEYTLEPVLNRPAFAASLRSIADATNKPLPGLGLRSIEHQNPNGFYLTIDISIQMAVEQILDQEKICGAVVVLDVHNGDILAMASRPLVNLTNMGASITDPESPFINRAVTAYPPGSIFKIVILCT